MPAPKVISTSALSSPWRHTERSPRICNCWPAWCFMRSTATNRGGGYGSEASGCGVSVSDGPQPCRLTQRILLPQAHKGEVTL